MTRFALPIGARLAAATLLLVLPLAPLDPPACVPDDPVEGGVRALAEPDGRVEMIGWLDPGAPVLDFSPAMDRLAARGAAVQPRLLAALRDPARRDGAALVLARAGDRDALPHLIDLLSADPDPPEPERAFQQCVLHVLGQLTGNAVGFGRRFAPPDPPAVRAAWRAWYAANRDYLSTLPARADPRGRRVCVDLEAKLARTPVDVYRRVRPRVRAEDVLPWRDDPGYEAALREFCYAVLLDTADGRTGAVHQLADVPGPRALAALHGMCELAADADDAYHLILVLGERGDPASLPAIERIPRSTSPAGRSPGEERRALEVERLRLRAKYARELEGKPFDVGQQRLYLRCLDGGPGVAELVAELENPEHDCFLPSHAEVAGLVDRPEVRAALARLAADAARTDLARTLAHAALARLGSADSLAALRRALAHPDPGVRLAAARGLWRLGRRDGARTLVELLGAGPLETGGEGVRVGDGTFTVTAVRGGTVEVIRGACALLAEMGEAAAIPPLRRLLAENLNGVLAGGGSGAGWPGRPDAVALARLGDFSGVPALRAAVAAGDRLDVVRERSADGDFVVIGMRRFVPELLPLLAHRDPGKRAAAARDVLILLDRGR
jgi:hypothetical protein